MKKITVKDSKPIILTELVYSAPRAAMFFVAAYFVSLLVLPIVFQLPAENAGLWVGLISFGVLAVFVLRQSIDAVLHARNTSLEITKTSIDCEVSGFTTNNFSIPLNQISSVRVTQAFLDKFFGVGSVVISQIAGTFAVYGFDYEEAKKFAQEFSKTQQAAAKN